MIPASVGHSDNKGSNRARGVLQGLNSVRRVYVRLEFYTVPYFFLFNSLTHIFFGLSVLYNHIYKTHIKMYSHSIPHANFERSVNSKTSIRDNVSSSSSSSSSSAAAMLLRAATTNPTPPARSRVFTSMSDNHVVTAPLSRGPAFIGRQYSAMDAIEVLESNVREGKLVDALRIPPRIFDLRTLTTNPDLSMGSAVNPSNPGVCIAAFGACTEFAMAFVESHVPPGIRETDQIPPPKPLTSPEVDAVFDAIVLNRVPRNVYDEFNIMTDEL